jgi:hypothetical protein
MISLRIPIVAVGSMLLAPSLVQAGMPSLRLTDMAEMRLQSISFFLFGFLLCAGLIKLLWNWLRKDFAALPRLSYPKALGVVALWGLLFVLVLTMISGARELMTPGAWEKAGLTYKLSQKPGLSEASDELARHKGLDRLRVALWVYARSHGGRFPESIGVSEIPTDCWQLPGPSGLTYLYAGGGQMADQGKAPVAYEPELVGSQSLVLWSNGEIRLAEWQELMRALPAGNKP